MNLTAACQHPSVRLRRPPHATPCNCDRDCACADGCPVQTEGLSVFVRRTLLQVGV
jgi:hypothetical protein